MSGPSYQLVNASLLTDRSNVSQNKGPLIAVMNIEIAKGVKDKLYLYEYDDDFQVAKAFQAKHGLPDRALTILHQQIVENRRTVRPDTTNRQSTADQRTHRQNDIDMMDEPTDELFGGEQIQPNKEVNTIPTYGYPVKEHIQDQSLTERQPTRETKQKNSKGMSRLSGVNDSQSMSRSQSAQNVTSRLYNQDRARVEFLRNVQYKATLKKDRGISEKEIKAVPEINEVSRVIASDRKKNKKIQDYLYDKAAQIDQKREKAKALITEKLKQECSFKPRLNQITQHLASSRPRHTFDEMSKEILKSKCTNISEPAFHPQINHISRAIVENKGDFLTRSKVYQQKKLSKIQQLRKQALANRIKDRLSGQQLFKPMISSRFVPASRDRKDKSIGEYLHKLPIHTNMAAEPTEPIRIGDTSDNIVKNMQVKRIIYLFGELDSDQDGLISAKRISIDTVSPDVLQILMPILFEMEQFGFQLNLDEFKTAVQALHRSLNSQQKSILYDYKRKRVNTLDCK